MVHQVAEAHHRAGGRGAAGRRAASWAMPSRSRRPVVRLVFGPHIRKGRGRPALCAHWRSPARVLVGVGIGRRKTRAMVIFPSPPPARLRPVVRVPVVLIRRCRGLQRGLLLVVTARRGVSRLGGARGATGWCEGLAESAIERRPGRNASGYRGHGDKRRRRRGRDGLEDAVVSRLFAVCALAIGRVLVTAAPNLPSRTPGQ